MISITNPKTGKRISVPCGHCINCLQDLQNDWSLRLTKELLSAPERPAVFITLTYNDENLPTEEFNEETGEIYKYPSVSPKDVNNFIKCLKTKINRLKKKGNYKGYKGALKYFIASEYGPGTHRPHYHGILFGLSKKDYDLINESWNRGFIYLGEANAKTIRYTSKYCLKPTEFSNPNRESGYFNYEKYLDEKGLRRKEFRRMSTKLGANYIESPVNIRYHLKNPFKKQTWTVKLGSFNYKMPRYYKIKLYTKENEEKYGTTNYGDNLADIVSDYKLRIRNGNLRKRYSQCKELIKRDLQDAKRKEYLLIQDRRDFLNREQRNHRQ